MPVAAPPPPRPATALPEAAHNVATQRLIEALYRTEAKAEIIHGRIVEFMATGLLPAQASLEVVISLREHARRVKRGIAVPDNAAFLVDLPHRKSFSPDAAYHLGRHTGMRFLEGAPAFAVEVRSEGDYGLAAEREMAAKRADYFAAGTLVVWDVDVQGEPVIRKYVSEHPEAAVVFSADEVADAEPAVPGWTFAVADLVAPPEAEAGEKSA